MKLQKKLAILLAALLVAPTLASCASDEAETQAADTAPVDTAPVETEITRATTPDTLPDGLDFGGESIRIIQGNPASMTTKSTWKKTPGKPCVPPSTPGRPLWKNG